MELLKCGSIFALLCEELPEAGMQEVMDKEKDFC